MNNTDRQPQTAKTADEFLFEYGIDTMSLNDDFNCQLLFAMERYAEHYASYQRDIKIGDKVAFNCTDKQPQTVYIKIDYSNKIYGNNIPEYILSKYYSDKIVNLHHLQELSNVYIFTPEELEALKVEWQREAASMAFRAGRSYQGMKDHYPNLTEYLNEKYPLPQPPKQ